MNELLKYNLNKKIINEKMLENPNIKNIENKPMMLPRNPSAKNNSIDDKYDMKSTNLLMKDEKKGTDFGEHEFL